MRALHSTTDEPRNQKHLKRNKSPLWEASGELGSTSCSCSSTSELWGFDVRLQCEALMGRSSLLLNAIFGCQDFKLFRSWVEEGVWWHSCYQFCFSLAFTNWNLLVVVRSDGVTMRNQSSKVGHIRGVHVGYDAETGVWHLTDTIHGGARMERGGWCQTLSVCTTCRKEIQSCSIVVLLSTPLQGIRRSLKVPQKPFGEGGLLWQVPTPNPGVMIFNECFEIVEQFDNRVVSFR